MACDAFAVSEGVRIAGMLSDNSLSSLVSLAVQMDDSEVINFLLQTEIIPLCLRIMDNGSELSKTVATFIIQKILLDEMGLRSDHRQRQISQRGDLDGPSTAPRLCFTRARSKSAYGLPLWSAVRFVRLTLVFSFLSLLSSPSLCCCSYICATYERFHTVSAVLTKMVRGLEDRPSVRLLKHIVRCYLRLSENGRARDALRTMLPARLRDSTFVDLLKDDPVTKRWLGGLLANIGGEQGPA